jgi:HK97 family phage major capsid protein
MPSRVELLEQKGRLNEEAKEILKKASDEGRSEVTKEEETKFNAIHADIEKITKHVSMLDKQDEVERSLAGTEGRKTQPNPIEDTRKDSRLAASARDQHDALRAWFLTGAGPEVNVDSRLSAAAKRIGMDLNKRSINLRLAGTALQSERHEDMQRWEKFHSEERALSGPQSTTSTGGYSIQDAAMREVEVALLQYGAMRQVARVLRTDTGGPLPIPTVNDTTNVGALIAENTTVSTQDIAFGQLVLDAYKYTSKAVLVSVELMQDNSVNLGSLLGSLLGERLGRITNTHFTTGTGTGQPNGVVAAATFAQAATGNTTAITFTNLITLYHSLDPAYRNSARFMMNDNSISKIKLMLDSQGRPLWIPGLVDRAPDTILGSPYTINQDMASMTISAKSILFGAFDKYLIRDVRDITLLRLDERYAEFLQVAFLAFLRTDGDLLNAGTTPIRGYQNST